MNFVFKNKASFLFALYLTLIVLFLNGGILFSYIKIPVFLIFIVLSTAFFNILFVRLLKSKVKEYLAASFILSSFVVFITFWVIYIQKWDDFVLLLGLFVVPSLLPASYVLLSSLFQLNKNKENFLSAESSKNQEKIQLENKLENSTQEIEEKKFILENENGKVLIELFLSQIICFEASDNYAVTYYLNQNQEVKKSMERVSLKRIEELIEELNSSDFERVHKSYIVNKKYVEDLKGKAQAYKLKMLNLQILVPVSRSYDINVIKKLID